MSQHRNKSRGKKRKAAVRNRVAEVLVEVPVMREKASARERYWDEIHARRKANEEEERVRRQEAQEAWQRECAEAIARGEEVPPRPRKKSRTVGNSTLGMLLLLAGTLGSGGADD